MPEQDTEHPSENGSVVTPATVAQQAEARTFTQAEVNQIVRDRLKQAEVRRGADQAPNESAERIQQLESQILESELKILRTEIAARHGISAEDRDALLTGTDADMLTAQAERLAAMGRNRITMGNIAPAEGSVVARESRSGREAREFTRQLFNDSGDIW